MVASGKHDADGRESLVESVLLRLGLVAIRTGTRHRSPHTI